MALDVHSAPSSKGTSRLSLRASRSSRRLARISCQNRKAEPTIPGTAAAQPTRSMAGSSRIPGAAQVRTTRTATSVVQAHSTTLAVPTARLTGGPLPPLAVGNYSPALPLNAVDHLLRLGPVLVDFVGWAAEADNHRIAPHVLQDGPAHLFSLRHTQGGPVAEPELVHAVRAVRAAQAVLRHVADGDVEALALDPSHRDGLGG